MFDYSIIKTLTPKDVLILNELYTLAKQAEEAEKQIKAKYLFRVGEDKIEVWHCDYNTEYLTHDGIWQARYLHQSYDVECTAETIFEYMKANYMVKQGYAEEYSVNNYTEEGEKALIFRYFNNFIERTAVDYAIEVANSNK